MADDIQVNATMATAMANANLNSKPKHVAKAYGRKRGQKKSKDAEPVEQVVAKLSIEAGIVDSKAFPFLDLPREIRNQIYSYCFYRPIALAPKVNFYRGYVWKKKGGGTVKYSRYQYKWETQRQELPQWGSWDLPSWEPTTVNLRHWLEVATPEENRQMELHSNTDIPKVTKYDAATDDLVITQRRYNLYSGHHFDVSCGSHLKLAGVFGVALLQVSKQLHEEGCEALYGMNTFFFDVSEVHRTTDVENHDKSLTGLVNGDGPPPTKDEIAGAMARLFDRKYQQPRFIWNDPLLKFLNQIGPYNSAKIKSIKVMGIFGCLRPSYLNLFKILGLERILQPYQIVLREACTDLKKVWLQGKQCHNNCNVTGDEDGVDHRLMSASQRADQALESFVRGLPGVTTLRLGEGPRYLPHRDTSRALEPYQSDYDSSAWDTSLRWVDFVNQRAKPDAFQLAAKEDTNNQLISNERDLPLLG